MPNTLENAWWPQLCCLSCPNKQPQCNCPSCSHWDGKSHCLDAILYITNLLLRNPGRDESVTEMCLPPGTITTPGQPREAPGGPALPWGTTPTLPPGHCCPQGLGAVRDGECCSHSASPLPVKLPLTPQLEFPVVGIHLAALPVLQLDPQGVGCPARQQVHGLVPQPVFPRRIPKALWSRRVGEFRVLGVPLGCPPPWSGTHLLVLPPAPLEAEAAVGTKLDDGPAPSIRLHVTECLQGE